MRADDPIRQGDVFRWLRSSSDPWKQHGIVVTADCDLAFDKHGGLVTYVPVLSLDAYLAAFFLPRRLGKQVEILAEQLLKLANELREAHAPEISTPFSMQAITLWFHAAGGASVAETLHVPGGPERSRFEELTDRWAAASSALADGDFTPQVEPLVSLRASSSDESTVKARLDEEISAHLSSLPGDGLFLSCIGTGLTDGYVAYVRRPRELDEVRLATRQSEAGLPEMLAQRVSRLGSPYRYRLTQQLGQVFGDVGLPADYEAARSENTHGLIVT